MPAFLFVCDPSYPVLTLLFLKLESVMNSRAKRLRKIMPLPLNLRGLPKQKSMLSGNHSVINGKESWLALSI